MQRIDLVGKRFGRLLVLKDAARRRGILHVECLCDCGKHKTVANTLLKTGNTQSCGCLRSTAMKKHGSPPGYTSWKKMRARCQVPTDPSYQNYGGRGIRVCDRWSKSLENFLADMGPKPSSAHSLDRIDVNGNYEPTNCRWALPKGQANNRRPCCVTANELALLRYREFLSYEYEDKYGHIEHELDLPEQV